MGGPGPSAGSATEQLWDLGQVTPYPSAHYPLRVLQQMLSKAPYIL